MAHTHHDPSIFAAALSALRLNEPAQVPEHRQSMQAFLDATPEEDQWLQRKHFINGSPALLMRSMVQEQGTSLERIELEKLYALRKALREFVEEGKSIPPDLRYTAEVSVHYWREVNEWYRRMLMHGCKTASTRP